MTVFTRPWRPCSPLRLRAAPVQSVPRSRMRWSNWLVWLDNERRSDQPPAGDADADAIEWGRIVPFIGMHVACLAVIWVGISRTAVVVALIAYVVRMFAITGLYHRYFSHRTFKTSRLGQFIFGVLGASAVQRGPIWWAA